MDGNDTEKAREIVPEMTVLDVIYRWRSTLEVFKKYSEPAGVCISCEALFETVGEVARRYGLDLNSLLADLRAEAHSEPGE
jgi:hypothetical protein